MATPQGDGSIILTTAIDQGGLKKGIGSIKNMAKTATKAFLAVGAAAATATMAIAKASVDAFAEYEQLVGGVETLFKGSSKKLIEYANQAYKTAGLSANQYIATVTGFSASLLQSLGGDTEKAADIANQALIDMSDNANKMGTSMESIQYAYQGFAKQNYTMLDNLKLGYGGTKTEMERLLKDAQALTGVKYDISNLADVYTAIHVIQENLGIAGTTALEAEKTISGSAATMKAAWQNVLTAISGGGDLDRAINNLVDSISNYFENIVPVVERALSGIGRLIEKVAPMLVQTVSKSLIKAIPSLLNAVYEMIIGLAKGIYQGIVDLFNGTSRDVLTEQADNIKQSVENQNDLTKAVEETNEAMEKTTASFDTVEILSSESSKDVQSEDFLPAIPKEDFNQISEIEKEKKEIPEFLQTTLSFISPITRSLGGLFTPIRESFNSVDWDGMIEKLSVFGKNLSSESVDAMASGIDSLKSSFEALAEPLKDLWDNALKPIVERFGGWIIDIVKQTGESFDYFSQKIKDNKEEISMVIEGIGGILSVIWSSISPIIESIIKGILPVLETTIDFIFSIIQAIGNFFSFFKNIFASVKSLIKGDTEEAVGYFKKALENLVNIFVGIGNSIISVINNLWTLIFDAFKATINSIGGIVEKIGSWLGFDWDLTWDAKAPLIPQIPKYVPKLAQGTVVPPNREFLAVLGDNKKENEIVSPVSTMKQAFMEAMVEMGGNFGGNTEVVLEVDGREFGRAVVEQGNRENRRIGTRLVIV